jgi:hypothetical protein
MDAKTIDEVAEVFEGAIVRLAFSAAAHVAGFGPIAPIIIGTISGVAELSSTLATTPGLQGLPYLLRCPLHLPS